MGLVLLGLITGLIKDAIPESVHSPGGMLLVAGCLAVSADSVERMMETRVPRDDTAIRCRYEFVLI